MRVTESDTSQDLQYESASRRLKRANDWQAQEEPCFSSSVKAGKGKKKSPISKAVRQEELLLI